jgi:soluble lytic murein transglycosylase-like protein
VTDFSASSGSEAASRTSGGAARFAGLLVIVTLCGLAAPAYGIDLPTLMAQGQASYRAGDLEHARNAFGRAASLYPASARAALWLGAVAVARGERAEATGWFQEVLRRQPSLAEASCAAQWLDLLGTRLPRPRWRLGTPADYALFVRTVNPSLSGMRATWLGQAVVAAAKIYGIDPRLLAAVVFVESRFHHASVSPAGAQGLAQLMPGTAAALGVDPRDPLQNLAGAARLLDLNMREFNSVPLGLAAYNAGTAAVRWWAGVPPYAETRWYVWAVLWVYDGLTG